MNTKCSSCGVRNALKVSYRYGKMRELCLRCSKDLLRAGKCPLCGFGLKTKTHATECLTESAQMAG